VNNHIWKKETPPNLRGIDLLPIKHYWLREFHFSDRSPIPKRIEVKQPIKVCGHCTIQKLIFNSSKDKSILRDEVVEI
jgi:hypothetical protein